MFKGQKVLTGVCFHPCCTVQQYKRLVAAGDWDGTCYVLYFNFCYRNLVMQRIPIDRPSDASEWIDVYRPRAGWRKRTTAVPLVYKHTNNINTIETAACCCVIRMIPGTFNRHKLCTCIYFRVFCAEVLKLEGSSSTRSPVQYVRAAIKLLSYLAPCSYSYSY